MIKCLYQTIKIDYYYSVNSFLYVLKKLPILRDLFTNDIYQGKWIKNITGVFGVILSLLRAICFKLLYYFVIYAICTKFFPKNVASSFTHIYFFLTILGLFINNKLLNTGKKKYFSLIVFQMDGTKFFRASLLWSIFTNILLNSLVMYIIGYSLLKLSIVSCIFLVLFTISCRIVGEKLNIMFYRKYHYIWYSNTTIYFMIVGLLFGCCFTPFISFMIPFEIIEIISLFMIIMAIFSFISLFQIDDYFYLYKQIQSHVNMMSSKNEDDYLRQIMVDVKEKDIKIDEKILEQKKGYDLFNTIFFQRHREILMTSAKKYAFVLVALYVCLIYVSIHYSNYHNMIDQVLHYKLAFFIIIMFFINRGSIITRAMFFNCDHAMLQYNFYREPDVMLGLFKKRLVTVFFVNLIPACVVGLGNSILLVLSSNWTILEIVTTFLFILSLSAFFSVHYLVIYYLLQPYNIQMEMKKIGYSIATIVTYVISFSLKDLVLSSFVLSIYGVVLVGIYIALGLWLVYKIAPITFKLN